MAHLRPCSQGAQQAQQAQRVSGVSRQAREGSARGQAGRQASRCRQAPPEGTAQLASHSCQLTSTPVTAWWYRECSTSPTRYTSASM